MGWKPEVLVMGNGGKWSQNALVFASEEEARASAHDLFMRWFACEDHRAVEVEDAVVNYRYVNGSLESVALYEGDAE